MAEYLLLYQVIWVPILDLIKVQKDAYWSKIIAHRINLQNFGGENGLSLIQNEIAIFNGLKLAQSPLWLIKPENREGKRHSSIILTVFTENDAQKAINEELIIRGEKAKIKAFKAQKPTDQCQKCQKFGHFMINCKLPSKCLFYKKGHETKYHSGQRRDQPVRGAGYEPFILLWKSQQILYS